MNLEQHMLKDTSFHEAVLSRLDLKGRHVFEVGAGTGVLTKLILDRGPVVTAWEIEPGLCKLTHPYLLLVEKDFRGVRIAYSGVAPGEVVRSESKVCLISNPPYELLPFILAWIYANEIEDVLLMIPEKLRDELFSTFAVEATLPGTAFSPESKGNHLLVRRGFAT
jgi:16S rRNA A1518/A1519 N6-dimethyltransferase RsmA/KsgA/DIM1 with predicted DNA glycosylase/AP lyase activity